MRLLLIYLLLFLSVRVQATVITTNASQASIAGALALANSGDVVVVQAGSASITSTLVVPVGVILRGSGTNQTYLQDSIANRNAQANTAVVRLQASGNNLTGLADVTLQNGTAGSDPTGLDSGAIWVEGYGNAVVVSNVYIDVPYNKGMWIQGMGVASHVSFHQASWQQPAFLSMDGYGGGSYGDRSWQSNSFFGSSNFWFFEDCTFTNLNGVAGLGIDAIGGTRYVVRYSFLDRIILGGHGTETFQRQRGTRAKEIYMCWIDEHGDSEMGHFRSGSGLVWSNTVVRSFNLERLLTYRSTDNPSPWGYADGTNPWDDNYASTFATGTASSGGTLTMTDSGAAWTVNQWQGYMLRNTTSGRASMIQFNDATTITFLVSTIGPPGTDLSFSAGNGYAINKPKQVLDGPGMGAGDAINTGSPAWPNEAIDPVYFYQNTVDGSVFDQDNDWTSPQLTNGVQYVNGSLPGGYTPFTYPHPLLTAFGNVLSGGGGGNSTLKTLRIHKLP